VLTMPWIAWGGDLGPPGSPLGYGPNLGMMKCILHRISNAQLFLAINFWMSVSVSVLVHSQ